MALAVALRTQLAAHPLGLGGAPLGNLYRAQDDAAAEAVVRTAFERGVRHFDTAPHYGHGLSEHRVGHVLRHVDRAAVVVSTKVGRLLEPHPDAPRDAHGYVGALPFAQRYDYSAAGVERSLADSLQRLGLARVDLVYVHDIDAATHGVEHTARLRDTLDGGLPALARLKAAGRIGGYGLGVNDVAICVAILRDADLDVILLAGRYTLADQTALPVLLPECERRGVAIVLGGPFNSGILATGTQPADGTRPYFNYAPASAEVVAHVAAIETVCRAHAVPLKAAALQFPLAHPAVACVIPGARSVAELEENLSLARQPIPRGFWQELRSRALVDPAAPLPGERS